MSFSRRNFLALVGTSFAGAAAVAASAKLSARTEPTAARRWVVESIGAVSKGAIPVTLRDESTGDRLVVDACRRGSNRAPVASSRDFDLFLVNAGDGHKQTPRDHVLAARALASHLDRTATAVPAPVLTMDSRLERHAELFDTNDDFVRG